LAAGGGGEIRHTATSDKSTGVGWRWRGVRDSDWSLTRRANGVCVTAARGCALNGRASRVRITVADQQHLVLFSSTSLEHF